MNKDLFPLKKNIIKSKYPLDVEKYRNNILNDDTASLFELSNHWGSIKDSLKWSIQRSLPNDKSLGIIVENKAYEDVDIFVDYFTEEIRIDCTVGKHISPKEYFEKNKDKIWEQAKTENKNSNYTDDYYAREIIYKQSKECTTFKISVTKALFKAFGSKVVLDPSSGWGDRILGAYGAGVELYHGVDPNTKLRDPYDKILKFIDNPNYSLITEDFLKLDIQPSSYDTVFTSPPFSFYEVYSKESTQSIYEKGTNEEWIKNFLYPYLNKAWKSLIEGGYFALYISNVGEFRYTMEMYDYINNVLHGKYFGIITVINEGKTRGFPIWVWKKQDNKKYDKKYDKTYDKKYVKKIWKK